MVFLIGVNLVVGVRFTVIEDFTMGVGGLFIEENLADGVSEKAGAGFRQICLRGEALGNRMW